MKVFDYKTVAREAGLSDEGLDRLSGVIRREFPRDDMMFELHMLRACMAIRDGHITIEQTLAEPRDVTSKS